MEKIKTGLRGGMSELISKLGVVGTCYPWIVDDTRNFFLVCFSDHRDNVPFFAFFSLSARIFP